MDRRKLAFALAFLGVALLVAVRGVWSVVSGPDAPSDVESAGLEEDGELDDLGFGDDRVDEEEGTALAADLVAVHGSLGPNERVRDAFGLRGPEPASALAPAEDDSQPTAWPRHHVSLVLLAGNSPAAVVDERVVRVGDAIAAGRVVAIAEEALRVEAADGGVLVYPLATEASGPALDPSLETAPPNGLPAGPSAETTEHDD